jgi:hypothetical protein
MLKPKTLSDYTMKRLKEFQLRTSDCGFEEGSEAFFFSIRNPQFYDASV